MSKSTSSNSNVANLRPVPLSPVQLARALKILIPTHKPIWIHGRPGVGKTSIVRQVCQELGYDCPHFPPAVTLDPVDVRGIPCADRNNHQTIWLPPNFWPKSQDWRGVIFVDELPQADKSVQSAFMQLTYGGTLGDYQLPPEATVVVCGNRQEDRAGTNRVITPLLNRFVHLGLEIRQDDWHKWAAGKINPVITSFLAFRPNHFDTFDPTVSQTAFASPRTWEIASGVFDGGIPDDLMHAIMSGCVGQGPATEFAAFARLYGQLPDIEEIIKAPDTYSVPKTDAPDVCYALAGALGERSKKGVASDKDIAALATYIVRLPDEFAVLAMREAVARNPAILKHAQKWLSSHRDVLLGGSGANVPT